MKYLFYLLFLVSLTANAQIRAVNIVDNLGYTLSQEPDEVVFVKGYAKPGDGGEGFFIFRPDETKSYKGMFVPLRDGSSKGRWERIRYDYVDISFFGAMPNDNKDDTRAIQDAIDFAFQNGFPQIIIPVGTFLADSLIIRNGTKMRGHYRGTIIKSFSEAKGPDKAKSALLKIDTNAVTNVVIENLSFFGNGHEKMCFYIEGVRKNDVHSGLWKSSFRNIEIRNFSSHSIYLKGGDSYAVNSPNQFISFESVRIKRNSMPGVNALRIEGQNAQLSFLNCTMDSERIEVNRPATSWNVFIRRDPEGGATPAIIKFDTCTIQNSIGAFDIYGASNVSIENCWFENIKTSIRIGEAAKGIVVENNRFANASGYGGLTEGYVINVTGESQVIFERNLVAGKYSGLTIKERGSKIHTSDNYPRQAN
ncbi:MAG: hypothetical protein HKO54_08365 [Flavobacteriaceae bacterium]|nr:hypothetical protein [Flavobacteriaceae bacterium]